MGTLKKSFSKLNILQNKLSGAGEYRSFFDFRSNQRKYLTVSIPYYDYIRGKIFIEDLREAFPEEVPFLFNIADLLYLLYDDLLSQVKRGARNQEIAQFLILGKGRYFSYPKNEKRVMKAISERLFEFHVLEEEEKPSEVEKKAYIDVKMRESEILRGEVLLHDLEPHMNDITITIEELLAIRFLDFIHLIKKEGNLSTIQLSIAKKISS